MKLLPSEVFCRSIEVDQGLRCLKTDLSFPMVIDRMTTHGKAGPLKMNTLTPWSLFLDKGSFDNLNPRQVETTPKVEVRPS